jgi:hypothetical protein
VKLQRVDPAHQRIVRRGPLRGRDLLRLPVLGYRGDGVPLLAADEIRAWLRRPTLHDDET